MEALEFLTQLTPGQTGILVQSLDSWRKVTCRQVLEGSVILQVHKNKGDGEISLSAPITFQTICGDGFLRIEGTLTSSDVDREGLELQFTPGSTGEVVNRRRTFRINTALETRLTGTATATTLESYESQWECVLHDLSVGGARITLPSPGPTPQSHATITFSLPTEDNPLVLPCIIVDIDRGANAPPLDTVVRLMFKGLTSQMENQLGKYINWVQLETRREGLL